MSNFLKRCSCGVHYTALPESAVLVESSYWWNCACKSTLSIKAIVADEYIRQAELVDSEIDYSKYTHLLDSLPQLLKLGEILTEEEIIGKLIEGGDELNTEKTEVWLH